MKKLLINFDQELLDKLRYLHKKEGPVNEEGKRRPFSVFIRNVLADHAYERMILLKGLNDVNKWNDDDFDDLEVD